MQSKLVGLIALGLLIAGLCTYRARILAQDAPGPAERGVKPYFYPAESRDGRFVRDTESGESPARLQDVLATTPYSSDLYRPSEERLSRVERLVNQLRDKSDPAKEAELKKIVEEEFDERHAVQLREAQTLAERLARLQERLKKRQANKAEIVARRVKQLLGQPDDLDWDVPEATRTIGALNRSLPGGLWFRNSGSATSVSAAGSSRRERATPRSDGSTRRPARGIAPGGEESVSPKPATPSADDLPR
jgi:hypothetical protein